MSELEERLNAVLSNPEEMSRIAAMAQKLMGELPSESAAAPSAPEAAGCSAVSPGACRGFCPASHRDRAETGKNNWPTRSRRI